MDSSVTYAAQRDPWHADPWDEQRHALFSPRGPCADSDVPWLLRGGATSHVYPVHTVRTQYVQYKCQAV